jgi:peptide/nickel transport system substrate-binding protein
LKKLVMAAAAAALGLGIAGSATAVAQNTLLYLTEDVPFTLDPDGRGSTHFNSQTAWVNLAEPLVDYAIAGVNDEGVTVLDYANFIPKLAESWSFDADTLTWTFNLRRGVKGCGGSTFTADDVLYTFARGKSISGATPVAWFLSSFASIANFTPAVFGARAAAAKAAKAGEPAPAPDARVLGPEVTKVDDYTVQFTLSAPSQMLLPMLTIFGLYVWDSETMLANATEDDPWSHKYLDNVDSPSFTAYCLSEWKTGEEFIVEANPDYYGKKPYFDRVIMRRVPNSASRVAILRTGGAQMTETLTPKEFDSLGSARGITVAGHFSNNTLMFLVNHNVPPFDDPRVRKAVALSIPYDEIVRISYFGKAHQWPGLVPTTYPGYVEPSIKYPYDPEQAKALLAEAGYPNGEGLEQFAGAFNLSYSSERESTLGPSATVIRSALREVGFPVDLEPMPQAQLADRRSVKKDIPFSLYDQSRPIGVDASYAVILYFVSPAKGGILNMTNYLSDQIDGLYYAQRGEGDAAKRAGMLAQIQNTLMDDLPWIPVIEYKTQWAFTDKMRGVTLHPDNNIRWAELFMEE